MGKIFLNNKLVEAGDACVSVSDSGFLYGAGLFETMRSYSGVVFRLADHLDRLFSSAEALGIKNTYDKKFITEAVYQTLKANELSNARLRLTLTSGAMSQQEDTPESTLVIAATELVPYPAEYYQNGVLVVLCPYRQNPAEPVCGHKTTNYFSRMLGLRMAHEKGAAEALWFTTEGRLAEGCISNIFLVTDSVLYTPPVDTPVLSGIARKTVCEAARRISVELVEKPLTIDDVLEADELFLTNVIMQTMPISKVEKHTAGNGKVGEITKRLQKSYEEFIDQHCGRKK